MMIEDGNRVAAGGARLQWHIIPIADIDLIARNTRWGEKWGRVFTWEENGLTSKLRRTSPATAGRLSRAFNIRTNCEVSDRQS